METAVISPAVVDGPPVSLLSKIESFFNESQYRETIESSANYNTRLCIERRLRMPFLDSQTGMAQNHSNLFMSSRQRMPGFIEGQIYTYPSKRWRKKRRQYLTSLLHANRSAVTAKEVAEIEAPEHFHTISTVENPAAIATDEASKDSIGTKEETPKDTWYYDDLDMQEMDPFDEPDLDSDYDYEESYRKKKKRPPKAPRSSATESPHTKKVKTPGPGRGRKKGVAYSELTDSDKPFSCDICGARYKTRPGLSYHFTHTHKDKGPEEEEPKQMALLQPQPQPQPPQQLPPQQSMQQPPTIEGSAADGPGAGWSRFQDSYVSFLGGPETPKGKGTKQGGSSASGKGSVMTATTAVPPIVIPNEEVETPLEKKAPPPEPAMPMGPLEERKNKAAPSPYCDFCLGDATENKKSGTPEELVSCSDCGRSGHPTCLQFTPNMIISVRKYRWQCIECKCCSVCGTSDNDDQLLFCDDCDRGYHMYCLSPPLTTPPEGSWSCRLCLLEFHKK